MWMPGESGGEAMMVAGMRWDRLLLMALWVVVGGWWAEAGEVERRDRYLIDLELDYGAGRFTGRQSFHWTNRLDAAVEVLEFNLYPNVGQELESETAVGALEVEEVKAEGHQVKWSLRSKRTLVRVEFERRIEVGERVEVRFRFRGRVPRVQREETSLLAHFMQEVNDALEEERVPADARDIFFAGEEALLICYFHPILVVRPSALDGVGFPMGLGRLVLAGMADYEVSVAITGGTERSGDLQVISSGRPARTSTREGRAGQYRFVGEARRGFALAIGEKLRAEERRVGRASVVSWYREGDQREGRRVLEIVAAALAIYRESFGEYPYDHLQVVEFPIAAGYSAVDLPGMIVLPQAYYVDLDAARLSGVIREQADVVRASFEFNIARAVAGQWWGRVVGVDCERTPFVAEALNGYAAIRYHDRRYGAALGDSITRQYVRRAYQAYRILGGTDKEAEQPARTFESSLQYAAIVQAKGTLLMLAIREAIGEEQMLSILRDLYRRSAGETLSGENLRQAFLSGAGESKPIRIAFQRWLREKRGDEDIGSPELSQVPAPVSKIRSLGRIFLKIGRKAARPF